MEQGVFPLFFDHQDNEFESREMEIGVAGPIFTHANTKALWDNNIHTKQDGDNIFLQLFIFMVIKPFSTIL